jgi:hypothetical protein
MVQGPITGPHYIFQIRFGVLSPASATTRLEVFGRVHFTVEVVGLHGFYTLKSTANPLPDLIHSQGGNGGIKFQHFSARAYICAVAATGSVEAFFPVNYTL